MLSRACFLCRAVVQSLFRVDNPSDGLGGGSPHLPPDVDQSSNPGSSQLTVGPHMRHRPPQGSVLLKCVEGPGDGTARVLPALKRDVSFRWPLFLGASQRPGETGPRRTPLT